MMENRARLLIIVALVALCAVALVAAFAQCGGQPSPAEGTPGVTAVSTDTPAPTPTPTREEMLVQEMQDDTSQSASSADECPAILQTEPWCSVVKSAVRITRPEWEELFPQTEFFLVKYDLYGGEFGPQQRNLLIVEQDGSRYSADSFDQLLEVNGITTITDENRELVAKAFALMTIPDYLEEEVVFTELEQVDMQQARHPYNYCLSSWTRIAGLEVRWCFVFQDEYLRIASGPVVRQYQVGDYIEMPPEWLPKPTFRDYYFRGE